MDFVNVTSYCFFCWKLLFWTVFCQIVPFNYTFILHQCIDVVIPGHRRDCAECKYTVHCIDIWNKTKHDACVRALEFIENIIIYDWMVGVFIPSNVRRIRRQPASQPATQYRRHTKKKQLTNAIQTNLIYKNCLLRCFRICECVQMRAFLLYYFAW